FFDLGRSSVLLCLVSCVLVFFLACSRCLRDLLSFPTRRSSDLEVRKVFGLGPADPEDAEEAEARKARGLGHADPRGLRRQPPFRDRKSTRLNSSHVKISYAVFCLKKKRNKKYRTYA